MANTRITIRLPKNDLRCLDLFTKMGLFSTRTEVIRHALNDFIYKHTDEIIEKAEKIKKVQQLGIDFQAMDSCILEK